MERESERWKRERRMKKDQINKENGSLREDKSAVDVFVVMIVYLWVQIRRLL